MDQTPRNQTPARSSPFQVRALHFLKKLALGRKTGKKSKDTLSPVAIPSQEFRRAHSSVDLMRKPDISRLIGLRVEDGPNPMDTDDSSQDASPSPHSPCLRPRRYSTLDSLRIAPVQSTFAGHAAAALLFHDQGRSGSDVQDDYPGDLLTPAPMFLRSNVSLQQPTRSPGSSPETPQITSPASTPDEAVHDILNNDTPRPLGDAPHDDTLTNPSIDPVPSTSSYPGVSRTQLLSAREEASTSETVQARPALLPHPTASLPPPFRRTTERGLRLSPSIITRQPMPLLNLPALPPPPSVLDTQPRQRERLRSMPSLFRHSRANSVCESDHENPTIGESEEEDGDDDDDEFVDASSVHQSDDEDDELPSAGTSGTPGPKGAQKRPARRDESPIESPVSPSVPAGLDFADFFCSKTYVQVIDVASSATSLAMYPFSPSIPNVEEALQRHPLEPDLATSGTRSENKPSLLRVASRSMINLGPMWHTERSLIRSMETSNPASSSGHTTESHEEWEESDTEAVIGRLLRRTSMPSFHPTSDPPPYPTFDPRPKELRVAPREDEGREWLPPYSNALYLLAIMPRKMEFSSPGIQAKDRKWRRVVCELEGTTFRVYKCPPGASGVGVLGDWWEKHVGVGDMAGPNPPRIRKKGLEEQLERPAKLGIDEPTTPVTPPASSSQSTSVPPRRQRTGSQSSMATQSTRISTPRQVKRVSAASFLSPFRSSSIARPEASAGESSRHDSNELELLPVDSRSSVSHESTGRATPVGQSSVPPPQPRPASRLTFLPVVMARRNGEITKPPESDLLRAYTLQHAESGLGNDYLKRKNVIRVRLEGEQFLLQAPDIPAVVEWIEALHAGTNIALDIDQRPMPRGPMFPRRRRRRTRRTQPENTSGQRASGSS